MKTYDIVYILYITFHPTPFYKHPHLHKSPKSPVLGRRGVHVVDIFDLPSDLLAEDVEGHLAAAALAADVGDAAVDVGHPPPLDAWNGQDLENFLGEVL